MPKAWARETKHSDCFKSKGHQDWKAAEILCAPLLVCTASSQIRNYVFPGKRKRRKKQLKNDAKKNRTHQSKKEKKKNIYQENCAAFCFVLFSCFVCFCMLLFCFAFLWHLHGFVFSAGFVCVCVFSDVVLLLLCLFFPRNLYCFSSYVFTNELIC